MKLIRSQCHIFQAAKKLDLRIGLASLGDGDGFLSRTSSRVIKRKTKTPPTLLNTMAIRAEFLEAVKKNKQNKPQSDLSSL